MTAPLDSSVIRKALLLFTDALVEHRDEIDSLNVYPVPDGDTGTNLLLTQQAVSSAVSTVAEEAPLGEIGAAVSRASLMGARGNSGVILSQVLRGLFERLPADGTVSAQEFALALRHAADEAYRAVARPEEGTVLTVLGDAADAAVAAAESGSGLPALLAATLEAARASLAMTREVHPALARAGVVDAGGKGIVLLLDAIRAAVLGDGLSERVGPAGPVGTRGLAEAPMAASLAEAALEHPFEVQLLLEADEGSLPAIRREFGSLGDSLVIVGGGGLYHVHVHTDRPDDAARVAQAVGTPRDVSVVDLLDQVEACMASQARAVRISEHACALVAVAEGEGLVRTFRSLGAVVVEGGPGNNPSVGQLLEAVEAAPAEAVVLLPNHRNVVPAAERAAAESAKRAAVIPTRSVPAGLSAAAAFNPFLDLEANAKALAEAAASRAGELVRAERDADTPAGPARRGDWMAMVEDVAVFIGASVGEAACEVLRRLAGQGAEVATLVFGAGAIEDDRRAVEGAVRDAFPHLELEVVEGGQPRYPFLIGAE